MKRSTTLSLVTAVALAGAATGAGALAAATPAPTRHIICSRASTWIPADYTGGCYLTFSRQVRSIAYEAFSDAARRSTQWQGSDDLAALDQSAKIAGMRCTRGGLAGLVRLNRWQAGRCTWTDTFGHYGLGDHPVHEWDCEVTVVVRTGPIRTRMRAGRVSMLWTVTAAPLDDAERIAGEFPLCEKNVDDSW